MSLTQTSAFFHFRECESYSTSNLSTCCGVKESVTHVDMSPLFVSEQKATAKGVTFVRVVVKGLGPGRLVSPKENMLLLCIVALSSHYKSYSNCHH